MSLQSESEQLGKITLFRDVDEAKRKLIAMSSDRLMYSPGDEVFVQGERAESVYLMLSGSVRIVKDSGEVSVELAHLDEPVIIGETGVLCHRPRGASVIASSKTEMLRIDGRVFIELLEQVPSLALALIRELSMRVETMNERLLRGQHHE